MQRVPLWLVLMGGLTAIGPLSIDMYLPSFPTIAGSLGTDQAGVQLTLAIFLIGIALGQLIYGPLSDRYGRKPPLYAGLVLYIVATVVCATAESLSVLIVARFFQALGGSAGVVISRAVIRDRTTVAEGARAFSMLMLVMGLAPILAPLLGGMVLLAGGWRMIFWVLALLGCLLLGAVISGMDESLSERGRPGAGSGVLKNYVQLFGHPAFRRYALAGACNYGGMFAYIVGSPYIFIELFGVPAQHFGWIFGLNALGFIVAAQFNAHFVGIAGPERILRRVIPVPFIAVTLGAVALLAGLNYLPVVMASLFVFIASLGFIGPNAISMALAEQAHRAGSASALLGMLQFLMGTVGGVIISLWHGADALPLLCVMVVFSASGWWLLRHRQQEVGAQTPERCSSR